MTDGYLVYGEKLFENYSGCDSYGYKYNKLVEDCAINLFDDGREFAYTSKECAEHCYQYCKDNGFIPTVLYNMVIEHDDLVPAFQTIDNCIFLGYDVAWTNFNHYSSVLFDIIKGSGTLQKNRKYLNSFGLFEKVGYAFNHLRERNLILSRKSEFLEGGEFHVIAVWRIDFSR